MTKIREKASIIYISQVTYGYNILIGKIRELAGVERNAKKIIILLKISLIGRNINITFATNKAM